MCVHKRINPILEKLVSVWKGILKNMEQDTSKYTNSEHLDLNVDIHSQNFDVIRLASYRTAVKFRFIQRRTHRKNYF